VKLVVNRVPEALPGQVPEGDDPFAAFTSETAAPPPPPVPPAPEPVAKTWTWPTVALPRLSRLARRILIVTLSVGLLVAAGFTAVRQVRARWVPAVETGLVTLSSTPSGAEVLIDGARQGVTPLTASLPVGGHTVVLRAAGASKELSITAKKNVEIVQNVELAPPPASTGALSVSSDPPGLKIAIDGAARGVTPAVITQLTPGNHVVTLTGKGTPMERTVLVAAGGTASLTVSKPAEPVSGGVGSVTVNSAVDVQLFEGDTLVGSSRSARLFLPTGSHTLTVVNDTLGFRRSLTVDVKPNTSEKVTVPLPNGALSINAQPWAEVILDGKSLGETPIGNYALPIGTHELVLRHPQLGERRETVVIGVGRTARIGVDLRK
jgi:hypothetical protein